MPDIRNSTIPKTIWFPWPNQLADCCRMEAFSKRWSNFLSYTAKKRHMNSSYSRPMFLITTVSASKTVFKNKKFHNSWALKNWMKNGCYPKLLAILTQFSTTWPSLTHHLSNQSYYQTSMSVESDVTIHKQSLTTKKI